MAPGYGVPEFSRALQAAGQKAGISRFVDRIFNVD
jgi:hypothetical protein